MAISTPSGSPGAAIARLNALLSAGSPQGINDLGTLMEGGSSSARGSLPPVITPPVLQDRDKVAEQNAKNNNPFSSNNVNTIKDIFDQIKALNTPNNTFQNPQVSSANDFSGVGFGGDVDSFGSLGGNAGGEFGGTQSTFGGDVFGIGNAGEFGGTGGFPGFGGGAFASAGPSAGGASASGFTGAGTGASSSGLGGGFGSAGASGGGGGMGPGGIMAIILAASAAQGFGDRQPEGSFFSRLQEGLAPSPAKDLGLTEGSEFNLKELGIGVLAPFLNFFREPNTPGQEDGGVILQDLGLSEGQRGNNRNSSGGGGFFTNFFGGIFG